MRFVGVGQIICVLSFPFGIEGGMWDVIVLIPDHCLSIFLELATATSSAHAGAAQLGICSPCFF